MAVKIRLLRMGKIRNPQYRIVIADSRTKRDGRAIEYIGIYQPKEHPSVIVVKSERVQYWLSVGAQPSEPVQRILEKTGDWQKFKGLPAPPPLLVKEAKLSKTEVYEAEAKAAAGLTEVTKPAATPKKAKAEKADKTEKAEKPAEAAAEAKPVEAAADTKPAEAAAEKAEDPAGAGADAS